MAVGKVIKSDGSFPEPVMERPVQRPQRPGPGVVSGQEWDAQKAAAEIQVEAKRKADEIIADAQAKREAIFEDAKKQGREQGKAEMTEQIARAKIQAGELLAQHEQDVIELACKLAEKIIGREVDRDRQALIELCATAVENVRNAKSLVLRVNPQNAATLRDRKKDLMDLIGRSVDLAIKEDPDIGDLGCVIQTEFGTVDAQLTTQLQILRQVLLEAGEKDEHA
jgi:type III secretion protein L